MTDAEIQLRLPARPENVALVRQAVSGIADVLQVDPGVLADIKTAVTEACNNVVLHAYAGDPVGAMEIDADPDRGRMTIVVRDQGSGMQPGAVDSEERTPGLGLPLIAALSDRFEIHGGAGIGIEVRMVFLFDEDAAPAVSVDGASTAGAAGSAADEIPVAGVAIRPGPLMAPVLGRLTAMLAARADFSLDRLSDAVLVTDAISAHVASCIPGKHATFAFGDGAGKRTIDLRVGPLVQGGGRELLELMQLPGLERSIEDLADQVDVEQADEGAGEQPGTEYLLVRLSSTS